MVKAQINIFTELSSAISVFINPICLPYDADPNDDYEDLEEPVYVAGWGVTGPRSEFCSNKISISFVSSKKGSNFTIDKVKIDFSLLQKEHLGVHLKEVHLLIHYNI